MSTSKHLTLPSSSPQWVRDLTVTTTSRPKTQGFPDPPGYASATPAKRITGGKGNSKDAAPVVRRQPTPEEMDTLKLKKAWEVALAPAKQLPMQGIGMYMTGNSLQVFSIFMVFTLFKNPLQQILATNKMFVPYETDTTKPKLLLVKLAYIVCNLLTFGLGVYKVNAMGLLPYVLQILPMGASLTIT
jgi:hypothetical protein